MPSSRRQCKLAVPTIAGQVIGPGRICVVRKSLRELVRVLRDLIGIEIEVVFRRRVEGEQSAERWNVGEVAAKLEAVIAAVPRQVVAKLMLLLKRLLRHVSIAADRKPVREEEQIQISSRVNAVVESLKLVGELVDRVLLNVEVNEARKLYSVFRLSLPPERSVRTIRNPA